MELDMEEAGRVVGKRRCEVYYAKNVAEIGEGMLDHLFDRLDKWVAGVTPIKCKHFRFIIAEAAKKTFADAALFHVDLEDV